MRTLYVNNFRGVSDALIPLMNVNFLVGENSTGKSSILSLVTLFADPHFWFNQDFNAAGIQLGTFQDIVSIDAVDRSYFQVGYVETREAREGRKGKAAAFLMTFSEKDGLPVIARFDLLSGTAVLRVAFQGKSGTFEVSRRPDPGSHTLESVFRGWVQSSRTQAKYARKLPRFPMPRRYVLPLVWSLLRAKRPVGGAKEAAEVELDLGVGTVVPFTSVTWIAPIRTKPHRTYDEATLEFSAEGTHTPYVIRELKKRKQSRESFDKFLAEFGSSSGLFRSVDVREFGKSASSPFSLEVTLGQYPLNLRNVGYGVSQSLPVIVELFARPKGSIFAIQQPEVHLHPRAQAALGDILFKLAVEENKTFFVETHSDFTIDRFRMNYRKAQKKPDAQVLFFERNGKGNRVTPLVLTDTGEYPEEQPKSFRAFFVREQLELLRD